MQDDNCNIASSVPKDSKHIDIEVFVKPPTNILEDTGTGIDDSDTDRSWTKEL